MSPVWIKLGDFGVSKLILAGATTTFHTQVSTQLYSAPEVLGLDSNSETSNYTNSVDIWSLGCVTYELLVGTKLFASMAQVSRYFFGKFPFPEDKLKALSFPISDVGISFLRSILLIQPEDRPSAAVARSHEWLADPKSDDEDSGDDQDEVTQSPDESARSSRSREELAVHDRLKNIHSERTPISEDDTRCIPRDVAIGANPRPPRGKNPTAPRAMIDASIETQSHVASAEGSAASPPLLRLEFTPHYSSPAHSKSPKVAGKKQIGDTPQTYSQGSIRIPNSNCI